MNPWIILILAILLEVSGTICLKLSHGMTLPLPIFGVIIFYFATFTLMSFSLKTLEVGIVYAIWSGVGTALIAAVGILFFRESFTWIKMAGLALVITGVLLLRVSSNGG
jgi:small multidrug resistance pump